MTFDIATVLTILVAAIVLFSTERLRVDVVSLMVLVSLVLSGILNANEAFSGFSNPAVITVWAIYMVSDGIRRVGVADYIGSHILRIAGTGEARLIVVLMLTVGLMSAFTNNIGATAILLPAVVSIGHRAKIPASKLLIPLSFGSLLGGVTTLIGTPPNLLASAALENAGLSGFALFDYAPMGLIILFSSIVYMAFVGRHLLPVREKPDTPLTGHYQLRSYLSELHILPESPLVGKTLLDSRLGELYGLTVVGLVRDGRRLLSGMPEAVVSVGDRLIVRSAVEPLWRVRQEMGVAFDPGHRVTLEELSAPDTLVAEVVVTQKARFAGQTLRDADFRGRFGLNVLAIWHSEHPVKGSLADVPVQLGDVLLVMGRRDRIDALANSNQFVLLGPVDLEKRRWHKAPVAVIIFALMIGSVLFNLLHISTAAVTGVVLYLITGCLTMEEAYRAVEWKSVFLIAGMLPLGLAMDKTGTAQFLASQIIHLAGGLGPTGVMVGLFVLTTIITEVMSNAAAAVLVAPIAITTAASLGLSPYPFVMGVALAASNSFVLPVGHQANVLVYGPGGYHFFDYARVGVPLTLLIWLLMLIFLPVIWPF